jgi:predicted  nucleic acid-binding Zn-ribbon protein
MLPDLEKLIRLQRAESDLKKMESELAEIPREKAALDTRLSADRTRLDAVRQALETSLKDRRRHEAELQDLETKRSRYKGQLMDVKTNKEYTAMLHEIENVEREIRAREDQVLAEMERTETLGAEIKREEGLFKSAEEAHRAESRRLDESGRTVKASAETLAGERDAIAATLTPDTLELFQRVAKLRGTAVAEAKDGMCQLCHVKLRLQMYNDLKRNDQIVQCPACSRILFYEPPVPTVAVEP